MKNTTTKNTNREHTKIKKNKRVDKVRNLEVEEEEVKDTMKEISSIRNVNNMI